MKTWNNIYTWIYLDLLKKPRTKISQKVFSVGPQTKNTFKQTHVYYAMLWVKKKYLNKVPEKVDQNLLHPVAPGAFLFDQ